MAGTSAISTRSLNSSIVVGVTRDARAKDAVAHIDSTTIADATDATDARRARRARVERVVSRVIVVVVTVAVAVADVDAARDG